MSLETVFINNICLGTQEENKQVELWHSYINWEKSNPLKVEDPALIAKRVMFAYEQVGVK